MNVNIKDIENSFSNKKNCAQIISTYFAKELNLDIDCIEKASASFGAGFYEGDICGSFIGGLIAIGLKYSDNNGNRDILVSKINEYKKRFFELKASNKCKEILGYNITIKEEKEIIEKENIFNNTCPKLVFDIIKLVEEL